MGKKRERITPAMEDEINEIIFIKKCVERIQEKRHKMSDHDRKVLEEDLIVANFFDDGDSSVHQVALKRNNFVQTNLYDFVFPTGDHGFKQSMNSRDQKKKVQFKLIDLVRNILLDEKHDSNIVSLYLGSEGSVERMLKILNKLLKYKPIYSSNKQGDEFDYAFEPHPMGYKCPEGRKSFGDMIRDFNFPHDEFPEACLLKMGTDIKTRLSAGRVPPPSFEKKISDEGHHAVLYEEGLQQFHAQELITWRYLCLCKQKWLAAKLGVDYDAKNKDKENLRLLQELNSSDLLGRIIWSLKNDCVHNIDTSKCDNMRAREPHELFPNEMIETKIYNRCELIREVRAEISGATQPIVHNEYILTSPQDCELTQDEIDILTKD